MNKYDINQNELDEMEKQRIIEVKAGLFDELVFILSQIITDLPSNKDWLCPSVERLANDILKRCKTL